ncbi:MAG: L-2-amino-thiazoline-4-carboxylic acid hydrolase [Candidatus Hodarchaeota archaeon]
MASDAEKLEQLKKYFSMLVNAELLKRFGIEDGDILSGRYDYHFEKVYSSSLDMMPDAISKEHGINPVFIIALHKALEGRDISRESLGSIVISIYKTMLAPMLKNMQDDMERSEDPFKVFGEMIVSGNKKLYENEFFKAEIIQADEDGYHLDIQRCLHVEIFEKNNLLELAPLLCEYDWIFADMAEKWVIFERKETIANGDLRCAFRYYPRKN